MNQSTLTNSLFIADIKQNDKTNFLCSLLNFNALVSESK